jgi:hypothetical protein
LSYGEPVYVMQKWKVVNSNLDGHIPRQELRLVNPDREGGIVCNACLPNDIAIDEV